MVLSSGTFNLLPWFHPSYWTKKLFPKGCSLERTEFLFLEETTHSSIGFPCCCPYCQSSTRRCTQDSISKRQRRSVCTSLPYDAMTLPPSWRQSPANASQKHSLSTQTSDWWGSSFWWLFPHSPRELFHACIFWLHTHLYTSIFSVHIRYWYINTFFTINTALKMCTTFLGFFWVFFMVLSIFWLGKGFPRQT